MALLATTVEPKLPRRSGNYPPPLCNDAYIQSLRSDFMEEHANRIEELKEGVRQLIVEDKVVVEHLELVDTLQQMGVAYHFEKEIIDVLANIYKSMEEVNIAMEGDLYAKALLFRLLREHGFTVSQDIFNSFKDGTGRFDSRLSHDTRGLLSLHKASYYATEGEEALDEARELTDTHLTNLIKEGHDSLESLFVDQIRYELEIPLNWRWIRTHCRWFIKMYQREENQNPSLVEFAKLNFNMVQSIHKNEAKELSRWWSDLNICGEKLSFARSRLLENYLAAAGWVLEPKQWRSRETITKFICLITVTDDIYDVYGTLDELELFTAAVERWEVSAMEQLPEYMKIHFLALFNTVNDVAYKILRDKGVDILLYLKNAWIDLCKSFLVEAKWYYKGYTPTLEEYLENAWISISTNLLQTVAFCVNEDVTIEALKGFESYRADKMRPTSMIFRLCNDLSTSTDELKRGDVPKAVQCCMHEKGISETLAQKHIWDLINLNWKILNAEGFVSTSLEKLLRGVALNIPRTAHFFYQHGDGYGAKPDSETQDRIVSLLNEPILL